jgi:hypothetical protein
MARRHPSKGCRLRMMTTEVGRSWEWVVCGVFVGFLNHLLLLQANPCQDFGLDQPLCPQNCAIARWGIPSSVVFLGQRQGLSPSSKRYAPERSMLGYTT